MSVAFELIISKRMNQAYRGPAEFCAYEFSLWPEQIPGTGWAAQQIVDANLNALAEQGSQLLELRMWEDTAPTWTTDYKVEIVATASPLWWNLIIVGVFALLLIAGVAYTITKVEQIARYSPISVPLMALAAIAVATVAGVYLIKRRA